jgi:hypothetical protein
MIGDIKMKTIKKEYTVYTFDELSNEAKDKAICDYIEFMLEVVPYENGTDNYKKAIDKAENMRTPWFTDSYVYEYCKDEIIEDIKLNEYDFNIDGSIFNN